MLFLKQKHHHCYVQWIIFGKVGAVKNKTTNFYCVHVCKNIEEKDHDFEGKQSGG